MLSHVDITNHIQGSLTDGHKPLVDPFREEQLQPASYDLRLDRGIILYRDDSRLSKQITEIPARGLLIRPGDFVLGATIEKVNIPETLAARFEGKSSLGRSGLLSHITAGFVDPGFSGTLTVELACINPLGFVLYQGMRIGQICFFELDTPASVGYGEKGHYQNQPNRPVEPNKSSYIPVDYKLSEGWTFTQD